MSDLALPGANAFIDGTALPSTLWMQLHIGNPGSNGTANVAVESVRKSFTRTAAASGVSTNASQIQWLNVPETETITHISIWSLVTAGVCWFIDDVADLGIFTGDSVTVVVSVLSMAIPYWT